MSNRIQAIQNRIRSSSSSIAARTAPARSNPWESYAPAWEEHAQAWEEMGEKAWSAPPEKPQKGIFIQDVSQEQLIKLVSRINKACGLALPKPWYDAESKQGILFADKTTSYPPNPVGKAFKLFLSSVVNFVNKGYETVDFYDKFWDNKEQWINVDQLNTCPQKWFFIYAFTHPCREFLHASHSGNPKYMDNHLKTLHQDVEIFDWMCKQITGNPNWAWLDRLKQANIYKTNENLQDGEYIKGDWEFPAEYSVITTELSKTVLIKTYSSEGKWTKFELYNLKDESKPIIISF